MSSQLIDPKTRQPIPPSDGLSEIPCHVCGKTLRLMVGTPHFYNMPSTTIVAIEHAGPSLCPGCLTLVTPCVVSLQNAVLRAMPVKVMRPNGEAKAVTAKDQPDAGDGASEESPLDPTKIQ